ncbi:YigZ family protein [Neiella marina]|uniref:YigZ family protein n=1 Tax=Neiella holothuriorum TaxID=2870530 RepID=A0ABS7EK96_9GAMM|nr:YigZ family protein [Neiella holothuriorum]MBW8192771.1 YigZ family protein [Neiella holothuriorum]
MSKLTYWRPVAPAEAEIEVKNSRFIAYLEPVENLQQADQAKAKIRELHPNARHHCWAQLVSAPDDVHGAGASDDGEPGGTAGRPMLAVLTGKPAGYLMVMVVRYFGGVKLGTGGLVRAYSGAVRAVCDVAQWQQCLPMAKFQLVLSYSQHQSALHLLNQLKGDVCTSDFTELVQLSVQLPQTEEVEFTRQLEEMGAGSIQIKRLD